MLIFNITLEPNFIWNYRYRGPAHIGCNINYKETRKIAVIFHNPSGYDLNLFIKQIACSFPGGVSVLPQTKEKYISYTKTVQENNIKFRFIDSFKFMGFSLDKLASYLKELPISDKAFIEDGSRIYLLKRKGNFSLRVHFIIGQYWIHNDFYNSLGNCSVYEDDHKHAQNV